MGRKKEFVIDGKNFSDIEGFYNELQTILTDNFTEFGKNLDAFDDILYGNLGKFGFNEEIVLIWENFNKSKTNLNKKFLEQITEIIRSHKNIIFKIKD